MVKPLGYPKETTPSVHGSWPVSCGEARLRLGWRLRFGRPRLDPAHVGLRPATRRGFFNRRGGNNDEGTRKTGKLVVEWVLQSVFGEIVRPGFGMFWEQRWIDFVNISPFCVGEGCLYRANGSDFRGNFFSSFQPPHVVGPCSFLSFRGWDAYKYPLVN